MKRKEPLSDHTILAKLTTKRRVGILYKNQIAYGKYLGWDTKRIATATGSTLIQVQNDSVADITFKSDDKILKCFTSSFSDVLYPVQSKTWIGFYILGWSIQRISDAVGVSRSTIKSAKKEIGEVLITASEDLLSRYEVSAINV